MDHAPRALSELNTEDCADLLKQVAQIGEADRLCRSAFAGAYEDERNDELGNLDAAPTDDEEIPHAQQDLLNAEEDMLEGIPLPGILIDEAQRRKQWLKLPMRARTAIRKIHQEMGHAPKSVLIPILRASKVPDDFVTAARLYKSRAW